MGVISNRLLNRIAGRDCPLTPLPVDPERPAVVDHALLLLAAATDVAGVDDYTRPLTDLAEALRAGAHQPEAAAVAAVLTGQDTP